MMPQNFMLANAPEDFVFLFSTREAQTIDEEPAADIIEAFC